MKDIGARVGCTIIWDRVRSVGIQSYWAGCNMQLSGGTAMSRDGGVHRDSRSAVPMGVGCCLLMCGGMCVLRGCGRVCPNTSYDPW